MPAYAYALSGCCRSLQTSSASCPLRPSIQSDPTLLFIRAVKSQFSGRRNTRRAAGLTPWRGIPSRASLPPSPLDVPMTPATPLPLPPATRRSHGVGTTNDRRWLRRQRRRRRFLVKDVDELRRTAVDTARRRGKLRHYVSESAAGQSLPAALLHNRLPSLPPPAPSFSVINISLVGAAGRIMRIL